MKHRQSSKNLLFLKAEISLEAVRAGRAGLILKKPIIHC